jgi:hypothetical protein
MIHLLFALLITQVQPVQPPASFSCYTYPPSLRITPTNANGLVCPALEPGDGSAKPGWTREYRCSVSGNTATCGPLENPGAGTFSKLLTPTILGEPLPYAVTGTTPASASSSAVAG